MMTKALFVFFLFITAFSGSFAAKAQECDDTYAKILDLRDPAYKTHPLWEKFYGDTKGLEQINDVVMAYKDSREEEDSFIIVGNFNNGDKDPTLRPFIARINKEGQVFWENRTSGTAQKTIEKVIKANNEYVVLGNFKDVKMGDGFYVSRYSRDGKLIMQKPVLAKNSILTGRGITEAFNLKGVVVAAERVSIFTGKKVGDLYRVNYDGEVVWQKKYSPGTNTYFNDTVRLINNRFVVVGSVEQEDGSTAGWALRMHENGRAGWQQTYPRGLHSSIQQVVPLDGYDMIMIGQIEAFEVDKKAAWIMKTDYKGSMIWERYFTGDYDYKAMDVMVEEDGRISFLLQAYVTEKNDGPEVTGRIPQGHTRVITMSPLGNVIHNESFTHGKQAKAFAFTKASNGDRLIAGTTLQGELEDEDIDAAANSYDGWLFSIMALNRFKNPCDDEKKKIRFIREE
jgi:hypothetical protein